MLPDGLPDDEFDDDGDSSESLIVLPDAVDIDAVVGDDDDDLLSSG